MSGIARGRLAEERKAWRRDHPHGFYAKPATNPDQSLNLMLWHCGIPVHHRGVQKISNQLSTRIPGRFPKGFFHPNIYPSGTVCLSILNEEWKPAITIKQLLLGIQELLDTPNELSPAQKDAYHLYVTDRPKYIQRVREQAKEYPPPS